MAATDASMMLAAESFWGGEQIHAAIAAVHLHGAASC